jgi:hypothetical protein
MAKLEQYEIDALRSLKKMNNELHQKLPKSHSGLRETNNDGWNAGFEAALTMLGIDLEKYQPESTTEAMDKVLFDFGYDVTDADTDFQGLVGYRHKGE